MCSVRPFAIGVPGCVRGTGLGQLASTVAPVGIIVSEVEKNSFHTSITEFRASADTPLAYLHGLSPGE